MSLSTRLTLLCAGWFLCGFAWGALVMVMVLQ